jgi:GNAT superfamily N-acetyltransferase
LASIRTSIVQPGSPELAICARWRADAFNGVLETGFEAECAALADLAADPTHQAALIATRGGVAAGTCLLVSSEIDPVHAVSPWLAGLYVAPEHRRFGVGTALVRAVEDQARARGHSRLYLYTDDARPFYERLGWKTVDRVDWKGFPTELMERDLESR